MHLVHIVIAVQLACAPIHMLAMAQFVDNVMMGAIWWVIVTGATLGISLVSLATNLNTFHSRSKVTFRLSTLYCASGCILAAVNLAKSTQVDIVCNWLHGTIFFGLLAFTCFSDCASTRLNLRPHAIIVTFQPWSSRRRMFRVAFIGMIWTMVWCMLWVLTVPIFQLLFCPLLSNLTTHLPPSNLTTHYAWEHSFGSVEHFLTTWPLAFTNMVLASLVVSLQSLVFPWHFNMFRAYRHCDTVTNSLQYNTTWKNTLWPTFTILAAWVLTMVTAALYLAQAAFLDSMETDLQKIGMPVMSITAIVSILVLLVWTTFVEAQLLMM